MELLPRRPRVPRPLPSGTRPSGTMLASGQCSRSAHTCRHPVGKQEGVTPPGFQNHLQVKSRPLYSSSVFLPSRVSQKQTQQAFSYVARYPENQVSPSLLPVWGHMARIRASTSCLPVAETGCSGASGGSLHSPAGLPWATQQLRRRSWLQPADRHLLRGFGPGAGRKGAAWRGRAQRIPSMITCRGQGPGLPKKHMGRPRKSVETVTSPWPV